LLFATGYNISGRKKNIQGDSNTEAVKRVKAKNLNISANTLITADWLPVIATVASHRWPYKHRAETGLAAY
jgi:hypothetical protein